MRNEGAAHFLVGSRQLAVGSKLEIKWPVARGKQCVVSNA